MDGCNKEVESVVHISTVGSVVDTKGVKDANIKTRISKTRCALIFYI